MLPKDKDDPGVWYAPEVKRAGFDYIELPIGQVVGCSQAQFEEIRAYLKDLSLPVHACNNYFPADIKLVGDKVDSGRVRAHYQHALEWAQALGSRFVVFGSPWSKSCPGDFPKQRAFEQLADWCREMGPVAQKHGLVIALEPNNRQETNMINTFAEVAALSQAADHPNVLCLQDYFHLRMEHDTVDSLLEHGKCRLVHAHFARVHKRGFPKSMDEDPYYQTFFDALRQIGYDGGLSMEGFPVSRESFPAEAEATCRFLRKAAVQG